MKNFVLASGVCFLLVSTLHAQQETQRFSFDLGGGFTQPVGNTGRQLDEGWNLTGGFGYNFSQYFGTMIDLGYNSFGISTSTLNNLGFPGSGVHIFSATLDPVVHLTPRSHFDLYVTGGGGLYRQQQDFTQPSLATVTGFNPFFGFYPVTVPTTEVLSSYSVIKPGVDIGAGIGLGTKWHGKFFAEARYDRIFITANRHTDYIPVSFGFRW
jgi:outer membrane protein with beta-barrel domain